MLMLGLMRGVTCSGELKRDHKFILKKIVSCINCNLQFDFQNQTPFTHVDIQAQFEITRHNRWVKTVDTN